MCLAGLILPLSRKVAVNKSKREEKIESTLESLRWELPRVGKLQGLIPSDDSALLVSKVYSNVVKFARSCILYYSRNSVSMYAIATQTTRTVLTQVREGFQQHHQTTKVVYRQRS